MDGKSGREILFHNLGPGRQLEFSHYFEMYHMPLIRCAHSILVTNHIRECEELACDCTQEAFARLLKAMHLGQRPFSADSGGEAHVKNWLFFTTKNIALEMLRKSRALAGATRGQVENFEEDDLLAVAFEDDVINGNYVRDLLSTLSPLERAIVWLRFGEDKPIQEIASILGMNRSAVSKRLGRILKRLRELSASWDNTI